MCFSGHGVVVSCVAVPYHQGLCIVRAEAVVIYISSLFIIHTHHAFLTQHHGCFGRCYRVVCTPLNSIDYRLEGLPSWGSPSFPSTVALRCLLCHPRIYSSQAVISSVPFSGVVDFQSPSLCPHSLLPVLRCGCGRGPGWRCRCRCERYPGPKWLFTFSSFTSSTPRPSFVRLFNVVARRS